MSRPSPAPTDRQRAAIESPVGQNVVSAAAGAGKTDVLTRRVVRHVVEHGADLNSILVVTFTEAAAAQMKARVRDLLLAAAAARPNDARLRRQLLLLPGAPISTIHAFARSLLTRHFHLLPGLDPGFRVLDADESDLLRLETAEALIGRLHESGDDDAPLLEEALGGKRGTDLESRILDANEFLDSLPDPETWMANAASSASAIPAAFLRVLGTFRRDLRAAKDRISAVDFADLESLALRILQDDAGNPTAVALALQRRFFEVLVDESQDLNPVQDRILSLVSRVGGEGKGNLFCVGDPKQSIYRFRLADPGLFIRRLDRSPARTHRLPENFRSRRRILDFANAVFDALLRMETARVPYEPDDRLAFRCEKFDPAHDPLVEVSIFEKMGARTDADEEDGPGAGDDGSDAYDREAGFAANRILSLVSSGACRFGDVAVLLRSRNVSEAAFLEAFGARRIPVRSETAADFRNAVEIMDLLSLLRVLDNPRQDIPLAAHLRSPVLGPNLSNADLARVRAANTAGSLFDAFAAAAARPDALGEAARASMRRLQAWRAVARTETLSVLLARLDADTRFLAAFRTLPQGRRRVENALAFLDRARAFDAFARAGLARFLRYVDGLAEEDEGLPGARGAAPGEDAVRILTIHGAKGMQFPVVFVPSLGRRFSGKGHPPILFDREAGIAAKEFLPLFLGAVPTEAWTRIAEHKKSEDRAEELRLLYVALTRAEERLVLLGTPALGRNGDFAKAIQARVSKPPGPDGRLPDESVNEAVTPLSWLLPILANHPDGAILRKAAGAGQGGGPPAPADGAQAKGRLFDLRIVQACERIPDEARPAPPPPAWPADLDARISPILSPIPPSPAAGIPARLTVTEMKRRRDADEDGETSVRPFEAGDWATLIRPDRLSAAERGRLFHSAFERLDVSRGCDEASIRSALDALHESGTLPKEARAALDPAVFARFLGSPLGRRIRGAKNVRREVAFSLRLPPGEADPKWKGVAGLEGEFVLVQGILDVLFDEGKNLVLVDYKTDSVSPDAAAARAHESHALQLSIYASAAERILKRPCPERWAVFLLAGASVPLHGGEPERW
ncbi:MAG: UvrD-helicase domain-containing protein [Planctomycetota bacterium]